MDFHLKVWFILQSGSVELEEEFGLVATFLI